ncbi:TIGR00730 family Rossman fold protein [Macrococcoides caseolyticum]|uniref:LOG family protein n=1 Tax=Macrococcoides caseolyticum TaxID=69966 RepID=UPI001F319B33|nr:TIGR00730 family Rossman fold protein [Macrococcus caseolyticus]MCE4955912.1 TIGR00730 family Rossman fold protein [Macrococcus caseolyticus]
MKNIAVFCGSNKGIQQAYTEGAKMLGETLAASDIGLIFGGGNVGLMGIIADHVIACNGSAIGVIPHFLQEKEVAHQHLTKLYTVDTMHQRKSMMSTLCDGYIMMPGGAGTLEEFFEIFTWAQLGLHKKPIGILNIDGFYNPLIQMLEKMIQEGFIDEVYRDLAIIDENPQTLINKMKNSQPV